MKKHFDFIIEKNEGLDKKVLRFYTNTSHVYGFRKEPPKTWKGVYKTYMSFAVLRYWEDDEIEGKYERPFELFSYYCDEGEGLRYLREVLHEILTNNEKDEYNIIPFGDGIDWEIKKEEFENLESKSVKLYKFTMVNDRSGQCYRFRLLPEEIKVFYEILNNFLEYMLNNSEGI